MKVPLNFMNGIKVTIFFVASLKQNRVYTKFMKEILSKQRELQEIAPQFFKKRGIPGGERDE